MESIKIRDVSGASLRELASRTKEVVGITNNRVLVAVLVPANEYWIQHVLSQNQTRVEQSLSEGEQVAKSSSLRSLGGVLSEPGPGASSREQEAVDEDAGPRLGVPVVGGHFMSGAALDAFVDKVRSLLPPRLTPGSPSEPAAAEGTSRRVRIGDLSGRLISDAAAKGDTLIVTNDRALTGVVVPVTATLVEQLIEQNLSRVFYNVDRGQRQADGPDLLSVNRAGEMPSDLLATQTTLA